MLKRILAFVLTLMAGTLLGSLTNLRAPRADVTLYPVSGESHLVFAPKSEQGDDASKTWVVIHSQPLAKYTEEARRHHVAGSVVLRVRLGFDGAVTDVQPTSITLPDGLTEAAVDASRKISFTPATVNGRPISVWTYVAYTFNGRDGDGLHGFNYSTDTSRAVSENGEDWHVVYE